MTNCIMRKKVSYGNSLHKLFSLILQEQQQKNPVEDGKDLSARTNRLSRQAQPTGVGLHHKRCFCMIRRAFIIINISYLLMTAIVGIFAYTDYTKIKSCLINLLTITSCEFWTMTSYVFIAHIYVPYLPLAVSSSDHCKKTKTPDNIIDGEDISPFPHFVWAVTYI